MPEDQNPPMFICLAQVLYSVASVIHTAAPDLFSRVVYNILSTVPELSECCDVMFVGIFNAGGYSLLHSAISFVINDDTE
jgi:hypothetical protein